LGDEAVIVVVGSIRGVGGVGVGVGVAVGGCTAVGVPDLLDCPGRLGVVFDVV